MTAANPVTHTVPISELAVGDKVLTATYDGKKGFDEVEALLHGASADKFVELTVSRHGAAPQVVRSTPHHTFPACSFKHDKMTVKTTNAKEFTANDCVMTTDGKGKVTSATMTPAAKVEEAYTIVLKGKSSLVAVGGVFTHALPHDGAVKKAHQKQKALRGSATALPKLSNFQKDVVDMANKSIKAAVAKKTKTA